MPYKQSQYAGGYSYKKPRPISVPETDLIHQLAGPLTYWDRGLYLSCYLTAGRISEVLQLKRNHVNKTEIDGDLVLNVTLHTLKNRLEKVRIIPIQMDIGKPATGAEYTMAQEFEKFIEEQPLDEPIFTISRTNAVNRFKKITFLADAIHGDKILENYTFHVTPHLLRHVRLTHLVQLYHMDQRPELLRRYAGWSSMLPATQYIHMSTASLARQLKRGGTND